MPIWTTLLQEEREREHLVESTSREHANWDVMHTLTFVSTGCTPSMLCQQQRPNA